MLTTTSHKACKIIQIDFFCHAVFIVYTLPFDWISGKLPTLVAEAAINSIIKKTKHTYNDM